MATVLEVMAKLSGNSSGMVQSFLQAQRAAKEHASEQKAASDGVVGSLKGMAVQAAAAIGGVALAYGAAQGAMADRANASNFISKMGISAADAASAAKVSGAIYSSNWGDSLGEVTDATVLVGRALGGVADKARLSGLTVDALAFSKAFGVDTVQSLQAAQTMVRTGLSPSIEEAYNLMTAGVQKGLNANEDLFDTLNEYGGQFSKLGLDGQAAMGLISQGMKAGARDTDYIADALKEFSIRAIDGSKTTGEGFTALGLDATAMGAQIARGGAEGNAGLATVLDKLRGMTDPVAKAAAATALFGTKAEDLGGALFALDPTTAVAALGEVAGSLDKLKQGVANSSTPVENFKRSFETALSSIGVAFLPAIDYAASFGEQFFEGMREVGPAITNIGSFISTDLVPALMGMYEWGVQNQGMLATIAGVITALMLPVLITLGVSATVSAATQVAAWATSGAGAVKTAAMYVVSSYSIVFSWVRQAAAAIASGATTVAIWALYAAEAIKGAAAMAVQAARVVGAWVLMGIQSMLQAARMAAAWFIALGPIGWVIAAVIGLAILIAANWDSIVSWTTQAFTNISNFLTGVWGAIVAAVTGYVTGLVNKIVGDWNMLVGFITSIFNGIKDFIVGVWTWIFNLLTAIGQAFWAEHGAQLTAAWNFIVAIFSAVLNFYISIWMAIINTVIAAVTWVVNAVVTGFTAVYNGIASALSAAWGFITSVWNNVMGFIGAVLGTIGSAVAGAWNWIVGIIAGALSAVWGVVSSVFNQVWGFISSIFNTVAGFIGGVWNRIVGVISGAVSAVWGAVSGAFQQVYGTVSGVMNQVAGTIAGIWNGIVGSVRGAVGQIGGVISGIYGSVVGALSGAGSWLLGAGRNIVQGLISGVQSLAGTIGNAFLSMVPGWIVGPFKAALGIASPSKLFKRFGRWIIQGLGLGVNAEEGTAVNAMLRAADAVTAAGSGITVDVPKIMVPDVPDIAGNLALPELVQTVRLNFVGDSPFEAMAALARQVSLQGPDAALAGMEAGTGYSAAAMGSRAATAATQAPVIMVNVTAKVTNPFTGEEVQAFVSEVSTEVSAGALSGTARVVRNSRAGGREGY